MKAEVVLFFFFTSMLSLGEFQDPYVLDFFNNMDSMREQTVIGRFNEDVTLPCLFESGPDIIIHWKVQEYNVHSYYKDSDQLERQDPRYANRTSLFHNEIHDGNASLLLRRLSLQDEGIYTCYVGTALKSTLSKVVLKVGALFMPQMKYERKNTSLVLTCCVLTAYPRPTITWHLDNTIISESIIEEMGPLSQFSIKSTLNNTFPNASYECVIENSLLQQTWTGRWTKKNQLHKLSRENISLSCQLSNNFSLLNQDFVVTWSKIKNGTSSVLAYFLSSSQNTSISESRFLWNKQLVNQDDFSSTLTNLDLSDSAEYLCNISSSKYTSLIVHTLDVGQNQENGKIHFAVWIGVIVSTILVVLVVLAVLWHRIPKLRNCCNTKESNHKVSSDKNSGESMPFSVVHQ